MFNPAKAYTYFSTNFDLKRVSPKGWYPMDCPFCDVGRHKTKFAVHFGYNTAKCWECEYKERLVNVIMDVEGVEYRDARNILNDLDESYIDIALTQTHKEIKKSNVLLPKGFTSLLDGEGVISDRVRTYLLRRGFDLVKLDMAGFGYCLEHDEDYKKDYFGYIVMPFKRKGVLQYYIGRAALDQEPKYKNPSIETFGIGKEELFFNEDALDLYDEVFLLEGYFDAICTGKSAMASLGWSLSDTQKRKILTSGIKRLSILPDKGFYKTAVKTAMTFMDHMEVVVVNMDNVLPDYPKKKDVNELGIKAVMDEYEITPVLSESMALDIIMT